MRAVPIEELGGNGKVCDFAKLRTSYQFSQKVLNNTGVQMQDPIVCFVWVEALRSSQKNFSHVGMFSWLEPVVSNEDKDEVSCSRTQYGAAGEI